MKDNVDLTQNRMFSRPSRLPGDSNRFLITSGSRGKYPWEYPDDTYIYLSSSSVITLGNNILRRKQKFYNSFGDNITCDCCGKRLNKFPWHNERGICHSCADHVYDKQDKNKCPWRKPNYFYQIFDSITELRRIM